LNYKYTSRLEDGAAPIFGHFFSHFGYSLTTIAAWSYCRFFEVANWR